MGNTVATLTVAANEENSVSSSKENSKNTDPVASKERLQPYDYAVGGLDNDGLEVVKMYAACEHWVVYRTSSAIRIDLNDSSPKMKEFMANHFRIGLQLARIYSLLPLNLDKSEKLNKLIARAMTVNVEGCFDDAARILDHAEKSLVKLLQVQGRLVYTLSAMAGMAVVCLVAAVSTEWVSGILPNIIICGAAGGFLSIAIGYEKLQIDVDANATTNSLIGVSRIVIAVIASIFCYFAVQSEVAFSFIAKQESNYGLYLIAMIAGFAEMLVPNIASNLAGDGSSSSGRNSKNNFES